MSIDIRRPTSPLIGGKDPTSMPAALTQTTALQSPTLNPEIAFALVFDSAPAPQTTSGAVPAIPKDDVARADVQTQIVGLFDALKATHLQVKPNGPAAKAFSNPLVATLAQAAPQDAGRELQRAVTSTTLPAVARRALDKATDAFWGKKLAQLAGEGALVNTPLHRHLTSPAGAADLRRAEAQVRVIASWVNGPKTPRKQDQTDPNAPIEVPAEVAKSIETLVSGSRLSAFWQSGDIGDAIFIMMMLVAKDASEELREQLKKMDATMKLKQAKRELIRQLKEDEAKLKEQAKSDFERLRKDGVIDESVSFDDYLAACPVTYTEPVIDETTFQATYTPPTIGVPDPIPESMRPQAAPGEKRYVGPKLSNLVDLGAQRQVVNTSALNDMKLPATSAPPTTLKPSAKAALLNDEPKTVDPSAAKKALDALTDTGPLTVKPEALGKLKNVLGGAGQETTDAGSERFTFSDLGIQKDRLTDELDSLSGQTEIDQLKMQMYLDRRQKAFDTASNVMKKLADTSSGIVKNLL